VDELSELEQIGRVVRNSNEEVIIQCGKYWNIDIVDIRWFKGDKPTSKGIRLNRDEAIKVLNLLRRELDEKNEN
jgi:hypothetical protein|tara:strand:- start:5565 stop:5786 length:222 start_codon:yes stop_codon:yes gene_type:complete